MRLTTVIGLILSKALVITVSPFPLIEAFVELLDTELETPSAEKRIHFFHQQ